MVQTNINSTNMDNCYKCFQVQCGCSENPDVPANCKATLPKEARLEIGREPPHPSIRAHLREEFRLETCDTCFKKPNRPVCGFIAANDGKKFTGLDDYDRESLWQFLGDAKYHLDMIDYQDPCMSGDLRCLSVKCQFLLTLIILRRNYDYGEAGALFGGISDRIVSSVFKTWIIFMSQKFR